MNYVKVLGLVAFALVAMLAFAGSATATTLTSPSGSTYTGAFKVVSEGEITLENPLGKFVCTWGQEGKVEAHGPAVTARGKISTATFTGCSVMRPFSVLSPGSLEFHTDSESADGNGTVTLVGFEITIVFNGVPCTYGTAAGLDLGTLTGSKTTGSKATIDTGSISIPRTAGSLLCGESAPLTGSFAVATPSYLDVD
jgi:hypothetical protein